MPEKPPQTVLISEEQHPVPVIMEPDKATVPAGTMQDPRTVTKGEGVTLSPTTTESEDLVTEGQRRINVIWEATQAVIAVFITLATIYCEVTDVNSDTIKTAFAFIVATYITRTNHTKQGGISPEYKGR